MDNTLKKVMRLIEKTQSRCIIVDENANPAYIMMPVKDFEALADTNHVSNLTEEEFIEKINRDLSVWRSAQEDEKLLEWEFIRPKKLSESQDLGDFQREEQKKTEDTYYFEPID